MKNKINNISDVFREAKKHLWDGVGYWKESSYICNSIECITSSNNRLKLQAKSIIQKRLGKIYGVPHNVMSYLERVVGVPSNYLHANPCLVQQYRKDWLTALEEEFKPKLKPKKGFNIHHIGGDVGNNDLINLACVKTNENSNWK